MSTDAPRYPARRYVRELANLPRRIRDLENAVQENRQLNRRVAELTDVVTELLVPLARRGRAEVEEVLARYRSTI